MTISVDKGVPLPPERNRKSKYPWHEMSVGDSFLYDGGIRTAQSATAYYHAETGKTFKARILDDMVRVWRTA